MVQMECQKWANKGINIRYQVRENRKGYKSGALKDGLTHQYVKECEYVAIFDADFQPDPDFLLRSIPYLAHNPELALVQARWVFGNFFYSLYKICEFSLNFLPVEIVILKFYLGGFAVNSDECLLTRMQEMSLDYHFTVEQEVGSSTHAFFGFNGNFELFCNLYRGILFEDFRHLS